MKRNSYHSQVLFLGNRTVLIYISSPDCASVVNIFTSDCVQGLLTEAKVKIGVSHVAKEIKAKRTFSRLPKEKK